MKKKVSNSIFARGIRFFLHQTEKWVLMNSRKQLQNPPVFIMGPPRSGTTLLYQLLTQTCHFSYFSEFAASYNTFPFLATYLKKKHFGKDNQSFKSDFGRPRGLFAPSEAGEIWNRWFPAEYKESYNYVDENHLDEKQKKHIYQLV